MANWNVVIFDHWDTQASGAMRYRAIGLYPSKGGFGDGGGWSDIAGQDSPRIIARSGQYCGMLLGVLDDATLALLQADPHYTILARWENNTDTPSFDNRASVVTTAQKNAFVSYFSSEFGLDTSKMPVISGSVGRTRQQVLQDILTNLRALR